VTSTRRNREGWLFVSPALAVLGLFLMLPCVLAVWVSLSDWHGNGSIVGSGVSFVGLKNYKELFSGGSLQERNLGTALRNNIYYVMLVVPLQTILALGLAVLVNTRLLRGRGFFRTTFYFPSVTSSVAITVLWLYLFSSTGTVNGIVGWFGAHGPNWFNDPRGLIQLILDRLGVDQSSGPLAAHQFIGVTWWDWLAGPSIAMTAYILMGIFTTSGTFMLLFIAALRAIGEEVDEAGRIDGASGWQRLRHITVPMIRPTVFTVVTLGLIGTWQVFDQIYAGTQGSPVDTTLTPAFLSYTEAFGSQLWGQGAAISFVLFAIIVVITLLQRWLMRERTPRRVRLQAAITRQIIAERAQQ